ncbi:hypothetical protein LA303_07730 [Candidatus Sulfidibacterium hydrothermale]|uniref:hypothetical protein n=1 Tax=Candidatus Sulfidibacterium hydrothermale TaxID=2875962 RepID=UPI001F0ABBB0|nr:hypothetical protein [Candidatus Sulfidibacterium hydrothermale]UBM61312.1 hypothetical protein LA303_07730 [Candidatus Sulfidibacterium hydrothermale]
MDKENHIEIIESENKVECKIKNKGTSLIVVLILGVFALIGFILPFAVFISSFIYNFNISFGFIITILIGFGTGYYLTKLILWNTFGLEKFTISDTKTDYYCDFKFFRSNKKTLNKPFVVKYITKDKNTENVKKENYGRLVIESRDNKVESQFDLPIKYLEDLLSLVNDKKNRNNEYYK